MAFWSLTFVAGVFGVLLTVLFWVIANPKTLEVVGMGDIALSLAIVGCSSMLLMALYVISDRLEKND
jgi:hypothetical protein